MTEVDPMHILPFEMQSILKRKSSRDPSSRFSSKLHLLLTYVTNNPDLEEKIGCAWVTEEEFRINKRVLVQIMGIKINTLNVNLHALGFNQQKHNKDGWTLWKRPGFTRSSTDIENSSAVMAPAKSKYIVSFKLGKVSSIVHEGFIGVCKRIWTDVISTDDRPVHKDSFIMKAAQKFKQSEQPLDNAKDVLEAIIAPCPHQDTISFNTFCKFMAMFGPEETIMLKIASLLSCSNNSGQWLMFETSQGSLPNFYGAFEEKEPNCLTIKNLPTGKYVKIWNLPTEPSGTNYITDESDKIYRSWDEYFTCNPLNLGVFFPQA